MLTDSREAHDYLAQLLGPAGVDLVVAELGRSRGDLFWILTTENQRRFVTTVHVRIETTQEAFAEDTLTSVARRLLRYLHHGHMISPANARIELADLPEEWRERVWKCLRGAWETGRAVGASRSRERNPFDEEPGKATAREQTS